MRNRRIEDDGGNPRGDHARSRYDVTVLAERREVRLNERLTRSGSLALVRTGGVRRIDGVGGDEMVGCRSLWRDNVGCDDKRIKTVNSKLTILKLAYFNVLDIAIG
jgi:hypothetical protein